MTSKDIKHTSRHWDSNPWATQEVVFWSQLESVRRRQAIKESGSPEGNWVDYTLERYFSGRLPLSRCLSLGCGRGGLERQLAGRDAFQECDAFDISPASIADASAQAITAGYSGIHYSVADLNQVELPAHHYDAVWVVGSAHHFTELERIFAQVAQSLKPGGLFILNEYVGANRFQFDPRQSEVIEACLNLLPLRYRYLPNEAVSEGSDAQATVQEQRDFGWIVRRTVDKLREGTLLSTAGRHWRKRQAVRAGRRPIKETALPTMRSVIAIDPSEAVRSSEIVPILETKFDILEYRPLGGTILQFLLADIAGNFQDEAGEHLLDILFQLEDVLIASGDISSDFVYVVARPRG